MAAGALADVRRDEENVQTYIADLLTAAAADARLGGSNAEQPLQTGKYLAAMHPPPPLPWPARTPPSSSGRSCALPCLMHLSRRPPSAGGKQCDVCEEAQSRYTCPACGTRTCSLPCSKGAGCSPLLTAPRRCSSSAVAHMPALRADDLVTFVLSEHASEHRHGCRPISAPLPAMCSTPLQSCGEASLVLQSTRRPAAARAKGTARSTSACPRSQSGSSSPITSYWRRHSGRRCGATPNSIGLPFITASL